MAIPLLNIADMKRGELMNAIDSGIQALAKDIAERDNVTGKRVLTINVSLEEQSGMVQILLDTQVKTPKSPALMAMGYMKDGKLVSQGDVDDIMQQPKLTKVNGGKTGTDGK